MSGLDWFPVAIAHEVLTVDGQTGGPLKVLATQGELLAVKRAGGKYRGLQHQTYAPSQFEVWEVQDFEGRLLGRRRLAFPVRS
jgi:hypothetical protein